MDASLFNTFVSDPLFKQMILFQIGLAIFMIVLSIVGFFAFRPIWCWYLKINQGIALLSEIRDLLLELNAPNYPQVGAEIERDTEIGSNVGKTPSMPVSRCRIDKPMHPSVADSKWMPPKNKP